MPSPFAITAASNTIPLDATTRRAEISFTVSNTSGRPMRGRAQIVPHDPATAGWYSLVGEAERDFAVGGTQQYTVHITVPPAAARSDYQVRLDVMGVVNPDEDFTQGPSVTFQTPAPAPVVVKKAFPWWIVIALVAVLVIGGGIFAVLRSRANAEAEQAALARGAQQTAEARQSAANATATASAAAGLANATATALALASRPTNTPVPPTARPTNTPVPPTATTRPTNTAIPPTATPRPVQWEVSLGRIDDDAKVFVNGTERHRQGDGSIRLNINQWMRAGDNEVEIVLTNGNCFATRGDFALFKDGTAVWNRTIDRGVSTCGRQYDVKFLVNFQTGAWSKIFEDDTAQA